MKQIKYQQFQQQDLFSSIAEPKPVRRKFISIYRVSLVRDEHIKFEQTRLSNSSEAQRIIRNLIKLQGQPDREQFCVLLLDAKNKTIGLNIVSTGSLSSATVHPREVLKPAILSNASAMILAHNHPSGELIPSPEDKAITKRIIQASVIIGITVHEHLIISIDEDRYFSFADQGMIKDAYDEI
ncbi:MAG: JAB domain-containing protein [Proteobacteria bacterium]|nr:JAB domain-containing protein [Pseudomonadota bacterium]MBU1389719.1 JAB domain-containing protein [Pseudomonadota bacterium]MBU1542657.1 JAB domain-containing protein [Pseudomonadota bacterium]MBU2430677.1 JAB domain-containing protein [Pseudomonadota bacterium]MBU2480730.1 JAB domain-containing protein [Pseudomonadota bacterium]